MTQAENGFTQASFTWFEGLQENNDKDWFDAHRKTFHSHVRDPFAAFLERLSDALADTPLPLRGSRKTMFRIHRDLRFTDDKRPYQEHVSGLLTPDGTKNAHGRILYVELGAGGGRMGGGMHRPKAKDLKPVRERILAEPDAVDALLATLDAHGLTIDRSDQVATMPRGFADHADDRHADLVRCKQLLAMADLPKTAWLRDEAVERAVHVAIGLAALYDFLEV
jgi:uncharacterized protein (TIGR02453 family)